MSLNQSEYEEVRLSIINFQRDSEVARKKNSQGFKILRSAMDRVPPKSILKRPQTGSVHGTKNKSTHNMHAQYQSSVKEQN